MPFAKERDDAVVITSLLQPRSVAVVGGSDDIRKPGARVLRNLQRHGFPGQLFPVNWNAARVQGLPSFPSIEALPCTPDLAIIAVPTASALVALRDCGQAGVKNVVMLSAIDLRDESVMTELASVIEKYPGMRVVGPNSLGVHSAYSHLAASFMTATDADFEFVASDVFVLAQSGGVGAYFLSAAEHDGLPVGAFISTGMELDLTFAEALTAAVDEYPPSLVLGYLEGTRDQGAVSAAIGAAHHRGVPVVLLHAGSTPEGRDAVARHNGLPTWDEDAWSTFVDPSGTITAPSIPEAVDLARALVHPHQHSGARTTVVAASGGAAILMTDAAVGNGLLLSHWDEAEKAAVAGMLPSHVVVENPIDATGAIFSPLLTLRRLLEACVEHPGTDIVVLTLGNMPHVENRLFQEIAEVASTGTALLTVVWSGGSPDAVRRLAAAGVLAFSDPIRCARALRAALDHPVRAFRSSSVR